MNPVKTFRKVRAERGAEEASSLVEMIVLTVIMLIGCIVIGGALIGAISGQASKIQQQRQSPSSCVINITTNACSK